MGTRHNDRDDFDDFDDEEEEEYEAHERCGDVDRDQLNLDDGDDGDPRPMRGGFTFSSTDWSGWED